MSKAHEPAVIPGFEPGTPVRVLVDECWDTAIDGVQVYVRRGWKSGTIRGVSRSTYSGAEWLDVEWTYRARGGERRTFRSARCNPECVRLRPPRD